MNNLRGQLEKLEKTQRDGNFVDADGNLLAGQDDIKALMQRCWKWTEIVLERYVLFALASPSITNCSAAKAKSMNASRTSMNAYSRFGTNWIGCLSHRPGLCERLICSDISGNWTVLMRPESMAILSMRRGSRLISMLKGYLSSLNILLNRILIVSFTDFALPDPTQLCIHLCPAHLV